MTPSKIFEKLIVILVLSTPLFLIMGRGLADAVMGFISISFLVRSAYKKDWSWINVTWFRLALVITGYMLISAFFAEFDKQAALISAVGWIRFPLFVVAITSWIWPRTDIKKYFLPSMVIFLLLVCVDTWWQFLTGTSLSGQPKPDYLGRLTGPLDRMLVGVLLLRLSWPVIGYLFAWSIQHKQKLISVTIAITVTAIIGLTVLISGERVAFALFALCGLTFVICAKEMRKLLLGVGTVGAILSVVIVYYTPSLNQRILQDTNRIVSNLSESAYSAVWTNGIIAWQYAPIMGVGPNNFVPMCEQLGKNSGFLNEDRNYDGVKCTRHPHNIYIEWAAETGLIGLGLFLFMVYLWFQKIFTSLRNANDKIGIYYQRLGSMVALIPFFWPLMSTMSFFSNWSAILFWWVMAVILSQTHDLESA